MFGQKLQVASTPIKAKRHHGFAFYVVGAFAFAIETMLGINVAFLVDQSLSIVTHNMLDGTFLAGLAPIIALIVALAVGFLFVFGGMWTFAGFMDSLDDARAYATRYTTWEWPVYLVWAMIVAVLLLDYTTLLFRAAYFGDKGAAALFWFFIILILMPPILGCLLHVLENTPRERRQVKAERNIEQLDADAHEYALQTMPDHLRTKYLDGDTGALDLHYQSLQEITEDARQRELDAMAARDEEGRQRRESIEEKRRNALSPAAKRGQRPLETAVLNQTGNLSGK